MGSANRTPHECAILRWEITNGVPQNDAMHRSPSAPGPARGRWAMTPCSGDPQDTASWRREILPACYRCSRLLSDAADKGLKLTGERWFGGHTTGRFEAKGMRQF